MSRRVSLPGADELFRTTGGMALQSSSPRSAGERRSRGYRRRPGRTIAAAPRRPRRTEHSASAMRKRRARTPQQGRGGRRGRAARARSRHGAPPAGLRRRLLRPRWPQRAAGAAAAANRRPSGRERHDEKITVYVSAEELMDLEHARLVLRGEHGLAVDRGRIVREAVAVVLADLESRGRREHSRTTAARALRVACALASVPRPADGRAAVAALPMPLPALPWTAMPPTDPSRPARRALGPGPGADGGTSARVAAGGASEPVGDPRRRRRSRRTVASGTPAVPEPAAPEPSRTGHAGAEPLRTPAVRSPPEPSRTAKPTARAADPDAGSEPSSVTDGSPYGW